MNIIENARKLRTIVEQAVQSLDDSIALAAITLYPAWISGADYTAGCKIRRSGKLYRCIQTHTSVEGWEPENTPALWEEINETRSGTLADPIPYNGNMVLTAGLHYIQNSTIYRCIRDTVSPVYSPLAELVGQYEEEQ